MLPFGNEEVKAEPVAADHLRSVIDQLPNNFTTRQVHLPEMRFVQAETKSIE